MKLSYLCCLRTGPLYHTCYTMRNTISLLSLLILSLSWSGCTGIFPDECEIWGIETAIYRGTGEPLPDSVAIMPSETYQYNLMNALYLEDYAGGGNLNCPVGNRRMPIVDSLTTSAIEVADVSIEQDSMLTIVGKSTGDSTVKVYFRIRNEGFNRTDSLKTVAFVQ